MAEVLLVSKSVEPPWNDSSKNLVRDLAGAMVRHHPAVMTSRNYQHVALGGARMEAVYSTGDAPSGMRRQLPVLSRLLLGRRYDLLHFFFAPNRRTSTVAKSAAALRRRPTIQTVCSAPAARENLRRILFADRSVVLSEHTRERFVAAGVEPSRLVLIPPCIPPLPVPTSEEQRETRRRHGLAEQGPLLVYPGDLEFSSGADRCLQVLAALPKTFGATLAICSRNKTATARARLAELLAVAEKAGIAARVRFLGEIADIHAVLGAADVVLLPSETLYAKMDLPLVLLEAMSQSRPVLVLMGTAAQELAAGDAARAVAADVDALVSEVARLLNDSQIRLDLGVRARARVLSHYVPEVMASAYEALYDTLL